MLSLTRAAAIGAALTTIVTADAQTDLPSNSTTDTLPGALASIGSLNDLKTALRQTPNASVAFIGEGDFASVKKVLPPSSLEGGDWTVTFIDDSADMELAVLNGTVLAGHLAGLPVNADGDLATFQSGVVSPRAFFLPPCEGGDASTCCVGDESDPAGLLAAIDASVMRLTGKPGAFLNMTEANAPFPGMACWTCATDENATLATGGADGGDASGAYTGALKRVADSGILRVGALGPFDFGVDGDYTVNPPKGFWPSYLDGVVKELAIVLGVDSVAIERLYETTSNGVLQLLLDGKADITEPYYATSGLFGALDQPRRDIFPQSCTTVGYEGTFFVKSSAL